eukprot:712953-Hanusia_phi.AAC.4
MAGAHKRESEEGGEEADVGDYLRVPGAGSEGTLPALEEAAPLRLRSLARGSLRDGWILGDGVSERESDEAWGQQKE